MLHLSKSRYCSAVQCPENSVDETIWRACTTARKPQLPLNGMDRMTPEEQAACRSSLLKYCGLDTRAMVRVWERLTEVIGNNP